ncbi:MAG TPA: hypothetical protein VK529_04355, partial [Gemmatimonadaceae bacterium]|nr:hypothetical protein [Gemmatimonadaceae bacterium]
ARIRRAVDAAGIRGAKDLALIGLTSVQDERGVGKSLPHEGINVLVLVRAVIRQVTYTRTEPALVADEARVVCLA